MVIWADWLEAVGTAMGTTTVEAGTMLSLIIIISLVLAIGIATKGKMLVTSSSMVSMLGLILFTYMGWLPLWTGSALALVVSIFIAKYVAGLF